MNQDKMIDSGFYRVDPLDRIAKLEKNTAEQQAKIDYLLEIVEGLLDEKLEN